MERPTSHESTVETVKTSGGSGNSVELQVSNDSTTPMIHDDEASHSFQIAQSHPEQYRLYKKRFFGLAQLVLLNIIISWDWRMYSVACYDSRIQ